jgi:hypothetical protein
MPYIKQEIREELKELTNIIEKYPLANAEEVNYIVTLIFNKYIKHKQVSYENFNSFVGALFCCVLEFYRRKIAPYEDIKIKDNGDV